MATDVPVTIWRTTDGLSDNVYTGLNFIVDPQGNFIVDTIGNFIIDTGIKMPGVPTSVWIDDDGK